MVNIKCNICQADNYQVLFRSRDRLSKKIDKQLFNLVKCLNCGLIYLNPQPSPEELKKYYPENYEPYIDKETIFKYSCLSKLLKKIFNIYRIKSKRQTKNDWPIDKSRINYLDFGCGGGFHLARVRQRHPNWKLYGLDNNQFACKAAKEKGLMIFCGDIREVELPKKFFDLINMSQVIEHLSNPKNVLMRLNKTMRKGGKIIISTPNFNSLAAKLFKSYWYALDSPRHLFLFTPKTLLTLLNKTGFILKKIEYKKGLNVEIKSFYYLLGKKDLRISPIIWRILKPISEVLSFFGQSSIITVYAEKVDEIP